tara:strand:- start:147 stop:344 length:198 start_codon:yes stop_codon:yes gene_type:complete
MSLKKSDFAVGDKVAHRWRNYYQKGVVIEIEEGCNGLIKSHFQDGFYGKPDDVNFPPQDLRKINE